MRRIVIYGNGLTALSAARELADTLEGRSNLELTVVAPSTRSLYDPLLPHAMSGTFPTDALTFHLADALRDGIHLDDATVEAIDLENRRLRCSDRDWEFDYLIVAPAPEADVPEHFAEAGTPAWSLDGAAELADRVDAAKEPGAEDRPIAVVGGGPAGVETASALRSRLAGGVGDGPRPADEPQSGVPTIRLFESAPALVPNAPAPLRRICRAHFRSARIDWQTDATVTAVDDGHVAVDTNGAREADIVALCTGLEPPQVVRRSPLVPEQATAVPVDDCLQAAEAAGVYAAGIAASPPGDWTYRTHLGVEQGVYAARNVRADLSGRQLRSWSPEDDSWLVSLGGDRAAVFNEESLVTGRAARVLYRMRHASWLPEPLATSGAARDWLRGAAD